MVTSVAWSPTGKLIVSASRDNTLQRWNTATRRPVGSPLKGHTSWINAVAFSPDGHRIISASSDKTLRFWNTATGLQIGSPLQGHNGSVTSVAFSHDGRLIVSGSEDKTLRLWDAASGKPIGTPLEGHESPVTAVSFSPDGRRIVSAAPMDGLLVWDATPASSLRLACQRLRGHHLLMNPEAFGVGQDFAAITHRARQVCANPPVPPPLTMAGLPPQQYASPLALRRSPWLQLARPIHRLLRFFRST